MEKKLSKVNKKKTVIKRRTILGVMTVLLTISVLIPFVSNALSPEYVSKSAEEEINQYKKISVCIQKGDTAWSIQESLTPSKDTRKMLYLVEKLNKKSLGDLHVGDTVDFLKE